MSSSIRIISDLEFELGTLQYQLNEWAEEMPEIFAGEEVRKLKTNIATMTKSLSRILEEKDVISAVTLQPLIKAATQEADHVALNIMTVAGEIRSAVGKRKSEVPDPAIRWKIEHDHARIDLLQGLRSNILFFGEFVLPSIPSGASTFVVPPSLEKANIAYWEMRDVAKEALSTLERVTAFPQSEADLENLIPAQEVLQKLPDKKFITEQDKRKIGKARAYLQESKSPTAKQFSDLLDKIKETDQLFRSALEERMDRVEAVKAREASKAR
jgi:hypothetical protein